MWSAVVPHRHIPTPSYVGEVSCREFWQQFLRNRSRWGPDLVQIWSRFGPDLVQIWSRFRGPDRLNQFWQPPSIRELCALPPHPTAPLVRYWSSEGGSIICFILNEGLLFFHSNTLDRWTYVTTDLALFDKSPMKCPADSFL